MAYLMAILPTVIVVVYNLTSSFAGMLAAQTYSPAYTFIATALLSALAAAYLAFCFFVAFKKSSVKNGIGCFIGAGILFILYVVAFLGMLGYGAAVTATNMGLACIVFFVCIAAGIINMAAAKRKAE